MAIRTLPLLLALAAAGPARAAELADAAAPALAPPAASPAPPAANPEAPPTAPAASPAPAPTAASPAPTAASPLPAQRPGFLAPGGIRVALLTGLAFLGGDFQGDSALVGPEFAFAVPKVASGTIRGISVGSHTKDGGTVALRWQRSSHRVSMLGTPSTAELEDWMLEARNCGFLNRRVQPCALLGVGLAYLDVRGGAVDATGAVGTARYRWLGFEMGVGTDIYLLPRLALQTSLLFHYGTWADGSAPGRRAIGLDRSFEEHGLLGLLGLAFDI